MDMKINSPIDINGHGTEVAGIIAADGQAIQGIAPKAKILSLSKFLKMANLFHRT